MTSTACAAISLRVPIFWWMAGQLHLTFMNRFVRNVFVLLVGFLLLTAMDTKKEQEQIACCYRDMYHAMIAKDTLALDSLLDDGFVLVHMTGMRQSKAEYLHHIARGTLNYYSCEDTQLDITVKNDHALLVGRSRVNAAVFGGGKHLWRLQLDIDFCKKNGRWLMSEARASTY